MSRTNHIDQIGPRAIGRKNKPTPRQDNDRCHAIVGGHESHIFVRRVNRSPEQSAMAMIPIIKGGYQCRNKALIRRANGERRCAEHLSC